MGTGLATIVLRTNILMLYSVELELRGGRNNEVTVTLQTMLLLWPH